MVFWNAISTADNPTSTGTTASKTLPGRTISSTQPSADPTAAATVVNHTRRGVPVRSLRWLIAAPTNPGPCAIELVTLATSGDIPVASSAGKTSSEPPPATALIAPDRKPTTTSSASSSQSVNTKSEVSFWNRSNSLRGERHHTALAR